jgi:hypothetical protein
MKTVFIIPFAAILFACGTEKEVAEVTVVEENTESAELQLEGAEEETIENYRIIGTVHLAEGCGAYIEAEVTPGEMKKLYPVNLEDQFKVESARIKFEYALSRAMLPEGCDAEMTVSVTDVTRIRN